MKYILTSILLLGLNIQTSITKAQNKQLTDISLINKHLQNNILLNSFFVDSDGSCCLIYNNSLCFRCDTLGDNWCIIAENIKSISVDPKNSNIYYAIRSNNEIQKSMDGGKNWITIQNGLPPDLYPTNILINPHNNSEIFINSYKGLYKTSDAGFTWMPFKPSIYPRMFTISSYDKNKYYMLSDDGLRLTNDAGLTWKIISNTLPKVIIKDKKGKSYSKNIAIGSFINYNFNDSSYIITSTEKGVYITKNDGLNWTFINNDISKNAFITSFFLTENEIYIGCGENINTKQELNPVIYKCDIQTLKWSKIEVKSNGFNAIYGIYKDKNFPGVFIHSNQKIAYIDTMQNVIGLNYGVTSHSTVLAFATSKIGNINYQYALVDNNNYIDVNKHGIWLSKNDGLTWDLLISYNPELDVMRIGKQLQDILIAPLNPREIWCFDNDLNYVSHDGGKTWSDVEKKYNISYINCFKFDPLLSNIIYFTSGYYETELTRFDKNTFGSTSLLSTLKNFIISNVDNKRILTADGNITLDGGWTWKSISDSFENYFDKNMIISYNPIIIPINIDSNQIIIAIKNNDYYENIIFLSSNDFGTSWNLVNNIFKTVKYVYSNPLNRSHIIISKKIYDSKLDKNGKDLNIIESFDNGKNWNSIFTLSNYKSILNFSEDEYYNEKFLSDFIIKIHVEQINNIRVYFLCTLKGLIYSNDNGKTWIKIGGIK